MDALQPDDPVNVGAYRLVGRLGAGGMGSVYLGVSPGGRKVAVKLIHPDYVRDREFRERFSREVEAARRVGGFHTAQVVDADPLADPPWMVTAFIQGPSLQDAVYGAGPLGPDETRALGAGLAEGLAAIHACGLVHRDVKPSNVILGDDGPRIIDFGIARLAGMSTMTASGAVLGTLAYMSPEQVKGEPAGATSDVFSLASTLVFAATGRSPFDGETTAAVVYRIANEEPDLTRLPGDAAFRRLIALCLAKNPADRPPLGEILADLSASGEQGRVPRQPVNTKTSADTAAGHPPTLPAWASTPTVTTGAPGDRRAAATRTLPRDIASFTGRRQQLQDLMDAASGAGGVVGIHAIGGMAGIGKTAFAVHAAHRLADRFPGGQIFLPLHGHTPGQQPVDPADALASLLLTAGVPAGQIPEGLQARTALWRDRLAERQLLLVLDDAASSEQVLPLLPGTGGSLVLVTSRRHLSALDDTMAISLDTLPAGEAAALLARLAGRPGLSADDAAVGEITRLCGYLPLAIGMVARQLRHHPSWSPAGRAAELAAARDRLELMATENLSVAAAFDLSYADLSVDQQRLFRRLGVHPGSEFDAYAAAALDGIDLAAARRGLEALYDKYLISESAQGRYRLHDLIREHARALAGRLDPDDDRGQATTRLLSYYQYTAARADALIARQTRPALATGDGAIPAAVPALADRQQALAWARAERATLFACLDHATVAGQRARVIALTAGLSGLLRSDGPWAEAITRHTAAVQAAQDLGDRLGLANALNDLGDARQLTSDYLGAAQALEQALDIYRDLGDGVGQANALNNLGYVRSGTGDYPAATEEQEQALSISHDVGDRLGQANALRGLGGLGHMTGNYSAAAPAMERALDIYRDLGDGVGQADALTGLGDVWRMTGDYPAAIQALEQSLDISRDLGDRLGQAYALLILGIVRRMTGDYPAAIQALEQSLDIYRDHGARLSQADALNELGTVRRITGDYPAAIQALEQSLDICRNYGYRPGQACALGYLGVVWRLMGDYAAAAQALEESLDICRDLGSRNAETETLIHMGMLHLVTGDLVQADECHQQALGLARATASSWDEAHALAGLGRCALARGHATQAESFLLQALEIFRRIGAAEVTDLLAELDTLTGPQTAG
jgi:tetratricopeptide (TPR) repeat protein